MCNGFVVVVVVVVLTGFVVVVPEVVAGFVVLVVVVELVSVGAVTVPEACTVAGLVTPGAGADPAGLMTTKKTIKKMASNIKTIIPAIIPITKGLLVSHNAASFICSPPGASICV